MPCGTRSSRWFLRGGPRNSLRVPVAKNVGALAARPVFSERIQRRRRELNPALRARDASELVIRISRKQIRLCQVEPDQGVGDEGWAIGVGVGLGGL